MPLPSDPPQSPSSKSPFPLGLTHTRDRLWAFLIPITLLCLTLLWLQSSNPRWLGHLSVDPVVYHHRAMSFLQEGHSWKGIAGNEYQPGALWFFAGVASLLKTPTSFDSFLGGLFLANSILIGLHIFLAALYGPKSAPWVMLLLALSIGPILLFRFELLVSLLVLLGCLLWKHGHLNSCALILGLATATKIYPILLAPLLAYHAWKLGGTTKALSVTLAWILGAGLLVISIPTFGGTPTQISAAVEFHLDKPYGIDGAISSVLLLLQYALDIPLKMDPRNGIHGFASTLPAIPTLILTWIWVPAILAILVTCARSLSTDKQSFPDFTLLFFLFATYVFLGKLMAPQYFWWSLSLLPLTSSPYLKNRRYTLLIALLCLCLISQQYIYPLHYSEFIQSFYPNPLDHDYFWINSIKNLLWLAALLILPFSYLPHLLKKTPRHEKTP